MADRGSHRPLLALVVLFVVFTLGLVSGAAIFHLGQWSIAHALHGSEPPHRRPTPVDIHQRGGFPPREVLDRMASELDLDQEQRRKMREIIATSHGKAQDILEEAHDELLAMLTDEQRERLDELSWGRHLRRAPGPPRGPHRMRRPRTPHPPPVTDAPASEESDGTGD